MNKQRREDLRSAIALLSSASHIVQRVCNKEEDCVENYPENLQGTERYETMEYTVDCLNDALDMFCDLKDKLNLVLHGGVIDIV